ncbi:MAG: TIGR03960 family B12-binding radical SAM protein [Elusimicrobiota bacterium]
MDLEKILPLVEKPSRYINSEWNSRHKYASQNTKNAVQTCFCFPDLYEIGMSNLGLEILYGIVNNRDDALAERVYAPGLDLEKILRRENLPLFSLESARPLKEFDLLGFTFQYELVFTNFLNILDLAGLPVRSKDRVEAFPLIAAGGPCAANPEPMADFVDFFVFGEGEGLIGQIIEKIKEEKNKNNPDKKRLLKNLARLKGVYVPGFYQVSYFDHGPIKKIQPIDSFAPSRVERVFVDLETAFYPTRPLVPFLDTVHNRLTVEIARGCPRACRFCQASTIYRPYRRRSLEKNLQLIAEALPATGYEEICLASLSTTDYPDIEPLVKKILERYQQERIAISLPSLRCDAFSLSLAGMIQKVKRANLTFAIEAGTDRLRRSLRKDLSEEQIFNTLRMAVEKGWKLIKLYFMFGLPGEKTEDVEGIVSLVKRIKKISPRLNLNITISPFVPKAHTPFQWAKQEERQSLRDKSNFLIKNLSGQVKFHRVEQAYIEGVLARGDRRLSPVIEKAWRLGCKFDQWQEFFNFSLWEQAFNEEGVDPGFYLHRERTGEEIFPWQVLESGVSNEFLWKEYLASKND